LRVYLIAALALIALAAPAQEVRADDIVGQTQDLGATPAGDVAGQTRDLVSMPGRDLAGATADLKFTVIDLGGKTQDLEVKETATEIRIELAADVLFDFDKATIKPEAASALHSVAEIIKDKGKGRAMRIEGHTDGKGGVAYNQKLSERRAASVKQWLAQKEAVTPSRMTTQGFGATKPVAPNVKPDGSDDPEGRQKNRRVEIVLEK
jgi:outer membrane protein OmpA-like peptidoglycan-associated protein